jgi:predicted small secreted protein
MLDTIDLAELYCLEAIVGPKPKYSLSAVPLLYAAIIPDQESPKSVMEDLTTIEVLGIGYLTEQLIEYPFIVTTQVGNHRYTATTKDTVYCVPLTLVQEDEVDLYQVHFVDRDTGTVIDNRKITGTELKALKDKLPYRMVATAVPHIISTKSLPKVKYKIEGGRIYEHIPEGWKKTFPFDVMEKLDY